MEHRFRRVAECTHQTTVTVISEGLERVICEECGNVSFRYEYSVSDDIARENFARRPEDGFLRKLIEMTAQETIEVARFSGTT